MTCFQAVPSNSTCATSTWLQFWRALRLLHWTASGRGAGLARHVIGCHSTQYHSGQITGCRAPGASLCLYTHTRLCPSLLSHGESLVPPCTCIRVHLCVNIFSLLSIILSFSLRSSLSKCVHSRGEQQRLPRPSRTGVLGRVQLLLPGRAGS
jgi:hypothetical protein